MEYKGDGNNRNRKVKREERRKGEESMLLSARGSTPSTSSSHTSRHSLGGKRVSGKQALKKNNGWATSGILRRKRQTISHAYEQFELEQGFCNPFRAYSPEMLRREVLGTPLAALQLMLRGAEIVTALGGFWLSLELDSYVGAEEDNMKKRAEELRMLLTDLGPAFVKVSCLDFYEKYSYACLAPLRIPCSNTLS